MTQIPEKNVAPSEVVAEEASSSSAGTKLLTELCGMPANGATPFRVSNVALDDLRADLATLLLDGPVCLVGKRAESRDDARNVFARKFSDVETAVAHVSRAVERGTGNLYVVRNPSGPNVMLGRDGERYIARRGRPGNPPLESELTLLRWIAIDIDFIQLSNRFVGALRSSPS